MKDMGELYKILFFVGISFCGYSQEVFVYKSTYRVDDVIVFNLIKTKDSNIDYAEVYSINGRTNLNLNIDSTYKIECNRVGSFSVMFNFKDTSGVLIKSIEKSYEVDDYSGTISPIGQNIISTLLGAFISFVSTILIIGQQQRKERKNSLDYYNSRLTTYIELLEKKVNGQPIELADWMINSDPEKIYLIRRNKKFAEKHNEVIAIINNYNTKPFSLKEETILKLSKLKLGNY